MSPLAPRPAPRSWALGAFLACVAAMAVVALAMLRQPPPLAPSPTPTSAPLWGLGLDLSQQPVAAPLAEDPADLDRAAAFVPGFLADRAAWCNPDSGRRDPVAVAADDTLLAHVESALNSCPADPFVRDLATAHRDAAGARRAVDAARASMEASLAALERVAPGSMAQAEVLASLQDRHLFAAHLHAEARKQLARFENATMGSLDPVFSHAAWSSAMLRSVEAFAAAYPWTEGSCGADLPALVARAQGRLDRSLLLAERAGSKGADAEAGIHGPLTKRIAPRLEEAAQRGWWPEVARLDMELGWAEAAWANATRRPLPTLEEAHLLGRQHEARLHTLTVSHLMASYEVNPLDHETWTTDPMPAVLWSSVPGLQDSFAGICER